MSDPQVAVGATFGPIEAEITADETIVYARATNDPNPEHLEGRLTPPVFTVKTIFQLYMEAGRGSIPQGAVRNARGGVHGSHDLYLHRPLVPGAKVTCTADTAHASNAGSGAQVSQHLVIADESGAPYVEHYWTTFYMGGEVDPGGPPLAPHLTPEGAQDRPIGSWTTQVADAQGPFYAAASGDHAPMHLDAEAAKGMGYPGRFMQGLCTFAMCSNAVIAVAAGEDPTKLRRLAARFSAPVFPPADLTVELFDAGTTADGRRAVAFEASTKANGATVVKHGWAELD
jgi:acyl dehydratase